MPDSAGKLTQEEHDKAVNWVNTQWQNGVACELCGTRHRWDTGWYVVAAPNVSSDGSRLSGGFYYPSIPVFCSKCGNTKFVNAFISGVMKPREKKDA